MGAMTRGIISLLQRHEDISYRSPDDYNMTANGSEL
ncbi:hypothetical protein DH86_00004239 [Scytalidium sp. 3C]|nr:hypothetical protein DH86_00004239 [Scytalidium sp. 3C]